MALTTQRLREIRLAALRRWAPQDNLERAAARIGIPAYQVAEALRGPIEDACGRFEKGATVDAVAEELSLPHGFVAYCFRWAAATAAGVRRSS